MCFLGAYPMQWAGPSSKTTSDFTRISILAVLTSHTTIFEVSREGDIAY